MRHRPDQVSKAVRKKLKEARVARLATVDSERRPHIVPVCFVYHNSVFYTAIDRKPKRVVPERLTRLRNIARAPQVALVMDHYSEDWTELWYVLVRGEAKLIPKSARAEHRLALQKLRDKYPQYAAGWLADHAPVIRITPRKITAWGKL